MNVFKTPLQVLLIAGSLSAVTACDQGPAEEAGEQLDKLVTDTGNAIEDACEDVKDDLNAKDRDC